MRTYRQLVWMFLATPFIVVTSLVLFNVLTSPAVKAGLKTWSDARLLLNTDFVAVPLSQLAFMAGISADPNTAVVGKQGWIFLGDRFNRSLTAVHRKATDGDLQHAERAAAGAEAWRRWFLERGVSNFWIMVAPDKDDIYPDYLPTWAHRVPGNRQDAVRAAIGPGILIDAVEILRQERPRQSHLLFKVTDSHWSTLGAWVATDAFFKRAAAADPTLRYPTGIEIGTPETTRGGDLTNLLRLGDLVTDTYQPFVSIGGVVPQTEETKFDPGVPVNPSIIQTMLMQTPNALNDRRVMWLRDSFGNAMTPHIRGTFSSVLEVNILNTATAVAALADLFKPELVLVTVVDRQSALGFLLDGPPASP